MPASELLRRLRQEGFELAAEGDRLWVRPQSALTDALRDTLRQHKRELLGALQSEASRERWRAGLAFRWARERGWLMMWDPQAQTWHEVPARECPAHWRILAQQARGRPAPADGDTGASTMRRGQEVDQ
ncbi:MAG TPA: hypothetical protein VFB73_11720 [Chloroflexota bacterium]|nr:hypothetical protein [Chloroflexota bacterium]